MWAVEAKTKPAPRASVIYSTEDKEDPTRARARSVTKFLESGLRK